MIGGFAVSFEYPRAFISFFRLHGSVWALAVFYSLRRHDGYLVWTCVSHLYILSANGDPVFLESCFISASEKVSFPMSLSHNYDRLIS